MQQLSFSHPAAGGVQHFFLPEMFKQTLLMIRHAQNYFEGPGKAALYHLDQPTQMLYANEMSRVTMRLSCVMAWCLGQQALVRGEIDETEAFEHFRLEGSDVCLFATADARSNLPDDMMTILDESAMLYERAWRLDQQIAMSMLN